MILICFLYFAVLAFVQTQVLEHGHIDVLNTCVQSQVRAIMPFLSTELLFHMQSYIVHMQVNQ